MKTANFVVALIYTIFLSLIMLTAEDVETLIGLLMFSVPVIINWISYSKWPNEK